MEIKGDRWDRQWGTVTHPARQRPPASFRLHLFYTYKLRVDLSSTMWWRVLIPLPRPPSLVLHLTEEGTRLGRRFRQARPSPVVLKVRLSSLFSGFHKQAQLWESHPPLAPSPTRLPGPPVNKGQLSSLCLSSNQGVEKQQTFPPKWPPSHGALP